VCLENVLYIQCWALKINFNLSLQVTVEGFIGGSVVLPCSSDDHDHKLQDTDVHWRHNGSIYVYDIINGKDSNEEQDPRYKNRTKTFPEEYARGNFSIKFSGLTHADAGKYICYITTLDEQETVELIINGCSNVVFSPTTEEGNTRTDEETRPDSVEKSWLWILVATLLTVLSVLFIVIIFRKKNCLKTE
uniref:Ig-like domain-containing protein n=1 Tax=Cyprinus carpio TaxID=7962 RepID=A0A8C2EDY0_CYPCA